jgi:hypothetical protein
LTESARLRWEKKINKTDTCWLWTGTLNHGYGFFDLNSYSKVASHRYSYFLANGQFESDLFVCHTCDTPACINPSHLVLGTAAFNSKERSTRGRSSRPFGEANGGAKLSQDDIDKLKRLRAEGVKVRQLMEMFSLSDAQIYRICNNTSWNSAQNPRKSKTREIQPISKLCLSDKDKTRFWKYVDKSNECWNWKGYVFRGYGLMHCHGAPRAVHRLSYLLSKGSIDDDLEISHKCGNSVCVKPEHLDLVDHKANMNNDITKARISKSSKGKRNYHKISLEQVRSIKVKVRDNPSISSADLARMIVKELNGIITEDYARDIMRGRAYSYVDVEGFVPRRDVDKPLNR